MQKQSSAVTPELVPSASGVHYRAVATADSWYDQMEAASCNGCVFTWPCTVPGGYAWQPGYCMEVRETAG